MSWPLYTDRAPDYDLLKVVVACLVEEGVDESLLSIKHPGAGATSQTWITHDGHGWSMKIQLIEGRLRAQPRKKGYSPAPTPRAYFFDLADPECFKKLAHTIVWFSIHPDNQ